MKPSQAFGVAVRIFGLMGWVAAFFYLLSAVVALIAPDYRAGIRPWWQYVVSAAVLVLVGWFLLRRAKWIADFAYRSSDSDASDS
jgi:membrane protein YdbS with pleckstrin-like domain